MGKAIQIRVDESLAQILERIRKEVAESLKKQYNLDEITIHGTLASQVAASRLKGNSILSFRIRKNGINRGILEIV